MAVCTFGLSTCLVIPRMLTIYCDALLMMISDIYYEMGCTKVGLVVTDTCTTMQKCWEILQDEFPWISCATCQTHCPSLLLKDIGKLPEPAATLKDEGVVACWFANHHKPLAILRSKVKSAFHGKSKELKKISATHMGSASWVRERLQEVKSCLLATVVGPEYVAEKYKDLPPDHEAGNAGIVAREHKGGTAKALVLDDSEKGFWNRVTSHVSITTPVCKFLRRHDTSAPSIGKVYYGWFEISNRIASANASYKGAYAYPCSPPCHPQP